MKKKGTRKKELIRKNTEMTEDYCYSFDSGSDCEIKEENEEIMVLGCMYPGCVVSDEDGKGAKVTLASLTEDVPNCEVHFVLADGYPNVIPPLKIVELTIPGSAIPEELRLVMEEMLVTKANSLVEKGEPAIMTSLLEDLSRMMIVAIRSSQLENPDDASKAFSYSMSFVDEEPDLINHPLIGSLFSMLCPDVILRVSNTSII